MKRFFGVILLCVLAFTSCMAKIETEYDALEDIPDTYTLDAAKADGCVVFEDGDVTYGEERWNEFVSAVPREKASVRLAFYYTLGDTSRYGEEYYESVKDEYPKLFIQDLSYDGEVYTLRWFENGEELAHSYKYMLCFEGEAETEYAAHDRYVRYVLVNYNTVTWADIMHGMFSSQMGDYIPHDTVYVDLQ